MFKNKDDPRALEKSKVRLSIIIAAEETKPVIDWIHDVQASARILPQYRNTFKKTLYFGYLLTLFSTLFELVLPWFIGAYLYCIMTPEKATVKNYNMIYLYMSLAALFSVICFMMQFYILNVYGEKMA